MKWLIITIILIVIHLMISYIMFILICKKFKKPIKIIDNAVEEALLPYKKTINKGNNWFINKKNNHKVKDIYINSFDNLKLHASLIEKNNHKGIIILCHGYRSTIERDILSGVSNYYNMGFSLLLVDQRTCGKSEGKYITFGKKESKDISCWVNYIAEKYPNKAIIIAGVSLGATSVLLTNNSKVKMIIADSGYSKAWEEVKYCINHYFHLPAILFMPTINTYSKLFAGFNMKKVDTLSNLNKIDIPILFIHGDKDDFVLPQCSYDNYNNYNGPKDLLIIKDAEHGMGYLLDTKKYLNKLNEFINKYL